MSNVTYPAWSAFSKRLSAELEKRGCKRKKLKLILAIAMPLYLEFASTTPSAEMPLLEELINIVIDAHERKTS